jgi:ABC-type dipeptide/oligopeptide/nickel transport system permease component
MGFLLSFLARRLAQGLLIVLLVSFGIFAILRLVPGDPVRMILGPMANAAAIEDAAKSLGLRDPIYAGSIFVSVPNFWCALVLVLIISAQLNLLPAIGYQGFAYTILPAIVIAIELSPIFMRALAVSIANVTRQNFIQLEAIRAIPAPRVFFHHTIRNAAVPILNLFGVQIGALLSGVLIVEYVFDYPGFGLAYGSGRLTARLSGHPRGGPAIHVAVCCDQHSC